MAEVVGRLRSVFGQFDGARATLYECPANTRSIMRLFVAELVSGTGVKVTVEIYKNDSTSRFIILKEHSLSGANRPMELFEGLIALEAGDLVEITATGSTPVLDAMVTVDEIFIPVG